MEDRRDFDTLLTNYIGDFGRYQKVTFVALSFVAVGVVTQNLLHVFTGAEPAFLCAGGGQNIHQAKSTDPVHPYQPNGNISHWRFTLLNRQNNTSDASKRVRCHFYTIANVSDDIYTDDEEDDYPIGHPSVKECSEWIYDTSQYKSSIVTQWDLVCYRSWLASLSQSLHFVGCLLGSLICGFFSDRFGRRTILLVSTVVQVGVASVTAYSPSLEVYAALRLVVGVAGAGQFNCAFIIAIEIVGPRWRNIAGIMLFYFNSFGIMLLAVSAYFVREWWILQLVVSIPLVLLLSYYWFIPESPRWLISQGKIEEAGQLLSTMAKWNRKSLPSTYILYLVNQDESKQDAGDLSTITLLRHSQLRKRTIILCFLWFSNSTTYYGLSLNTSNIGGNDYVNFFLSGIVELPAYTFCIWSLNRIGRKLPLVGSMLIAGTALLCTVPLADDMNITRLVLCMVGKLAISVSYCAVYPFTVELFPTVLRNGGLGLTSMFARVAGFIAPYILFLGNVDKALPFLVIGTISFMGGILCMMLPETKGKPLPETLEDITEFGCRLPCRRSGSASGNGYKNSEIESGDVGRNSGETETHFLTKIEKMEA